MMRFYNDDDFLKRASQFLHQDPDALEDVGDVIVNKTGRAMYPAFRDAAVLFSVIQRPHGLTTLLNLRPAHLNNHGGEVGFPGGKVEAYDKGPFATVCREAMEEIGLCASHINLIGYLDAYITRTGFRVIPVLCTVIVEQPLRLDPNEVQAAFEVPFSFLMNAQNQSYHYIMLDEERRFYYEYNYQDMGRTWRIWGATAGIIRRLGETLYPELFSDKPYTRAH